MNLKEAFRYQKFLDYTMEQACSALRMKDVCIGTVKTHMYSKADQCIEDVVEVVDNDRKYTVEQVLALIYILIAEKRNLTAAITGAKNNIGFDIDAALESNKFKFSAASAMHSMLRFKNSKRKELGHGYKFNVEGNQVPFVYDIDVSETELFDRAASKAMMSAIRAEADKTSTEIDAAMVNAVVFYEPLYDVNETFEDIVITVPVNK